MRYAGHLEMLFEWLLTVGMPAAGMAGGSYGIWDIWGSRCQVSTLARGVIVARCSLLISPFQLISSSFLFFKTCFQPTASILILCIWFNQYFLFAILITWFILSHFYHTIFSRILPISAMFVMLQSAVCIRVSIASNDFVICKCWSYF